MTEAPKVGDILYHHYFKDRIVIVKVTAITDNGIVTVCLYDRYYGTTLAHHTSNNDEYNNYKDTFGMPEYYRPLTKSDLVAFRLKGEVEPSIYDKWIGEL